MDFAALIITVQQKYLCDDKRKYRLPTVVAACLGVAVPSHDLMVGICHNCF